MADIIDIGLLEYPGVQEAALLGLADLFDIANRSDRPALQVSRWKVEDGRLVSPLARNPAVMIVPPGRSGPVRSEIATQYRAGLRQLHAAGTTMASVCVGAFILGEAGLLDGRTATTHWSVAEAFRARFADVDLDVDRLIVDDGDILTAGGMMAWTDLGLTVVGRFLGPEAMMATAGVLLVDPPGREQRYYSTFAPRMDHGDAAVRAVQHWLHASFAEAAPLADLAAKAGLEERTFLRRFRKATGMTTTAYLQRVRTNKARELLQFGSQSVDAVAWQVGYADPGAFRKVFMRITGLSPSAYRRRFRPQPATVKSPFPKNTPAQGF